MKNKKSFQLLLLIAVILSMLNNLEHSAHVYLAISRSFLTSEYQWLGWAQAIVVNCIVDLAIVIFVINGRSWETGIYALSIFAINLLYYDGLGLLDASENQKIAMFIYSAMFSYSIYVFSDMYFKSAEEENKIQNLYAQLKNYSTIIAQLNNQIASLSKSEAIYKNENTAIKEEFTELAQFKANWIKRMTCPECGYVGDGEYSINAHMNIHKKKNL